MNGAQRALLAALATGPRTLLDARRATGLDVHRVAPALRSLEGAGWTRRVEAGLLTGGDAAWTLTDLGVGVARSVLLPSPCAWCGCQRAMHVSGSWWAGTSCTACECDAWAEDRLASMLSAMWQLHLTRLLGRWS